MDKGYLLAAKPGEIKVTPYAYCRYAKQLLRCYDLIAQDKDFSPIPYYFCCRAIELSFKSALLDKYSRIEIKRKHSHDLKAAYLEICDIFNLEPGEHAMLIHASKLYVSKEFEYVEVTSMLKAFKDFPELDSLHRLAQKILTISAQRVGLKLERSK